MITETIHDTHQWCRLGCDTTKYDYVAVTCNNPPSHPFNSKAWPGGFVHYVYQIFKTDSSDDWKIKTWKHLSMGLICYAFAFLENGINPQVWINWHSHQLKGGTMVPSKLWMLEWLWLPLFSTIIHIAAKVNPEFVFGTLEWTKYNSSHASIQSSCI